jgi:hypothetical protein
MADAKEDAETPPIGEAGKLSMTDEGNAEKDSA